MIRLIFALLATVATLLASGCAVTPMGGYQVGGTAAIPVSVSGQRGVIVLGGTTSSPQSQQRVVYVNQYGQVIGQAGTVGQPTTIVVNNNNNGGYGSSISGQQRPICRFQEGFRLVRDQYNNPAECVKSTSAGFRQVLALYE